MTTTAPTVQTHLPEPEPPVLTSVVSAAVFAETAGRTVGCPHCKQSITVSAPSDRSSPIRWVLGEKHPIFDNLIVIRMFLVEDRGGVEIYSVTADRKTGVRHFVPNGSILLTEEGMPMPIFIEELTDAEGVGDPDETETGETEPAPAPNGQSPA